MKCNHYNGVLSRTTNLNSYPNPNRNANPINVYNIHKLEMWANAKRDGRPAEHRWRPLFNAAKFG